MGSTSGFQPEKSSSSLGLSIYKALWRRWLSRMFHKHQIAGSSPAGAISTACPNG